LSTDPATDPATDRAGGRRRGIVAGFDTTAGIGEIESGGDRLPFHCTALADGTRVIQPGAAVEFEVVAGLLGRWEATAIERR